MRNTRFRRCPARRRGDALASILSGAECDRGTGDRERALKQVSGPSILHVATHGFFLPDQAEVTPPAVGSPDLGPRNRGVVRIRCCAQVSHSPALIAVRVAKEKMAC